MKRQLRQRFRWLTLLQVLLLTVTIALAAVVLFRSNYVAVPAVLMLVAFVQVVVLVQSVHAHVDALEDFFAAINYEDFTRRFVEDDVDAELKDAFNRILAKFQDARAERDLKAGYLETVVRHVPVPFIAERADGELSLVNHPAKRLTGLPALRTLDDLGACHPDLPASLRAIAAGQQRLLQTRLKGVPVEIRVGVSEIRSERGMERLYSIEDLSGELTAREGSAWRNLIRVLTHEIMNTLTPVTSLAETTASLLDDPAAMDDVREAVTTIGRRSEGLMTFVSKYREFLQVPAPSLAVLPVADLLDGVLALEKDALRGIETEVEVRPASLTVSADRELVDQVLINLLKNAIDAVAESPAPRVTLRAGMDFGRTVIDVRDNGEGIPESVRDQIFIPFFTTKRDGSGIGLSLSRQIMSAHGGELVAESDETGTRFRLIFP